MNLNQKLPINILIIDDDEVDVRAIVRAIRKRGIDNNIAVARDGVEGLEMLKGVPERTFHWPWVVLLDINMPRMNGHEFLQKLRSDSDLKDTVVFVLTTSEDYQDMTSAYQFNIAGYVVKSDVGENFVSLITMLKGFLGTIQFHHKDTEFYPNK